MRLARQAESRPSLIGPALTAQCFLFRSRKLKNIEETERAKRAYWEQRNKPKADDGEFAAERCKQNSLG